MKEPIFIQKIENAGTFLAIPKLDDAIELYTEFLAELNNYFLKRVKKDLAFVPKIGDLCACRTKMGECDKELWYRCLVTKMYTSSNGITEVLLVDEGEQAFVTKSKLQRLPDEYHTFPHQVMKFVLNDLIPLTLAPNADLAMALRDTSHWDRAATRFVEKFTEGCETSIEVHYQDTEGTRHVTLYCEKDNKFENVNELLISKKYATLKNSKPLLSQTLKPDAVTGTSERNNQSITEQSAPTSLLPIAAYQQNQQKNRLKQKEKEQRKLNQNAKKEVDDLLQLINDDSYPAPKSTIKKNIIQESSETSDQSDIESTLVPISTSYKNAPLQKITEKLGKDNDFLSKVLGIESKSETTETSGCKFQPFESSLTLQNLAEENEVAKFVLENLGGGARRKSKNVLFEHDVLVYGKRKRDPITSLEQISLSDILKTNLKFIKLQKPSLFQSYMWPAVMALRNVVGIAENWCSEEAKIIGYIVPMLRNLLLDDITYKELGPGNGPYLIICVLSWQEAQQVYNICEKLTGGYVKKIRIDVRYGGMDHEDDRNIRLLNGCEILITTVPSLNNAIQCGYTNLNRLCHLVFDNVDRLVETFTEDIKYLMRGYSAVLRANEKLKTNQLIAVGKKWSYGVQSLLNSYFSPDDAMVIITNKLEIALFANVPFAVETCDKEQRLDCLREFLETDGVNESSVVFTKSAKLASDLQQDLLRMSISANLLTEYTIPAEVKDVCLSWNSSVERKGMNVLVMSDPAAVSSDVRNATRVIHYDFPKHKSGFANRLMCLLQRIRENENKEKPKELLSFVMICEDGVSNSTGLVKLLKRAGQKVPSHLNSMANVARDIKEENKQYSELCPRLKLFGECGYLDECTERHRIFPDKDLLGVVPTTGFVKVKILDIVSASCFWGRITEHRLPFEGRAYDTNVYLTLNMDLNLHYAKDTNRKRCTGAEKFDICVIKTMVHGYQRVRIEKILEQENERPKKLEVFGIDNGFTMDVSFDELFKCDDKFKQIPHQAIEIIACCVRPVEKGTLWTYEASYAMENRIKGKELEGRVKFSLQNTIWVDPLVEKETLKGMMTRTYTLDIARDLLSMKFAERNPEHLENLRKLLYEVQGQAMEVKTTDQGLPLFMIEHEMAYLADDTYEDVFVSSVVHPGLFYVRRAEQDGMLERLDDKIDATMKVQHADPQLQNTTLPIGYVCVAKFSGDDKWYRAKILGVREECGEYDVFFVDHGDREWIGKSKVVPAWPDILTLPFQAIQCFFSNIFPRGNEWTLEDGDKFWDMTTDRLLVVQTISVGPSDQIQDMITYEIELFDTSSNVNINISHELVYAGIAQGSVQCVQEMFPSARRTQEFKHDYERCSDLCLDIHQSDNDSEKITLARDIRKIFESVESTPEVLLNKGAIESVCKLVALTQNDDVKMILLDALYHVTKNNERCSDCVVNNNGLQIIYSSFVGTSSNDVKKSALRTLKKFAADIWFQSFLLDSRMIKTLLTMISESKDNELTALMVESIGLLCHDNSTASASLHQDDGLEVLCKLLSCNNDVMVLNACGKTFLSLLEDSRNKDRIRECGGLQELAFVCSKKINDIALQNFLKVLLMSIEDNELNREYLHRIAAHLKLKSHSELPIRYSMHVRKLFQTLINLISPGPMCNFISSHEIDPSFYEIKPKKCVEEETNLKKEPKHPMTHWGQTQSYVTLSIQLRGVTSMESSIEKSRVLFRTVQDEVEYELDIELYGDVEEEKSKVMPKGGEVLFVLFKVGQNEEWPRLLKSEDKLPNIRLDFDRWGENGDLDYFSEKKPEENNDSYIPFMPGIPKPPPCTPYTGGRPEDSDDVISDSSNNEDDEDSDDDFFYSKEHYGDFFKL